MTYDAKQTAPLGRSTELYEFVQSGVFSRFTSANVDVTVSATTYTAETISRNNPVQNSESGSGEVKITVPRNFDIAAQFAGVIPSILPTLTIYKTHLNDGDEEVITYWKGTIVNCAFNDTAGTATLFGMPETRVFERPVPRAVYSGLCNNQLFDGLCQVSKSTYSTSLTLSTVDAAGTTWTLAGLRDAADTIATNELLSLTAQEVDDFWQRGYIATSASPAEFRMIVETDIGADPNAVRVSIPFSVAAVGDSVTVYAGCPHSIDFCDRKFKNALNFGGCPYVPTKNPFGVDLAASRGSNNAVVKNIGGGAFGGK